MFKNSLVFLIIIKIVSISCNTSTTTTEPASTPPPSCLNLSKATFGSAQGEWNYANEAKWATTLGYAKCGGSTQSPINIDRNTVVNDTKPHAHLEFLEETSVELLFKNSTIEAGGDFSALYGLDYSRSFAYYNALQFHIHQPSEHTIDGEHYPLELHIVHGVNSEYCETVKNIISVVGIFFEVDDNAEGTFMKKFAESGSEPTSVEKFNLHEALISEISYLNSAYTYTGSLTTPPCHEVVNWFVLAEPMKITSEDLKIIQQRFQNTSLFSSKPHTNRATQPLNGRTVTHSENFYLSSVQEFSDQAKTTYSFRLTIILAVFTLFIQ